MITKLPGLPLPPANIDPQLASFLTALAETVEIRTGQRGDKLDRAVTLRELIEGGLATESQSVNFDSANISSGSIGFTGTNGTTLPGGGVSSPVAPLNFTATGLFSAISLSWTYATYFGHSHTEIWRSNTDVFADAFVLGITPQSVYIDPVGGDQTKYYWIRHVNLSGEKGPFFSQTPVSATTATDVDHILTIVSSAITASQLATDLASRIDLIDGVDLDGNPIAGSVAAQVATEAADRVSGIAAEAADRVSGIAAEAADRVSDIAAEAVARAADIATEVTNRGTAISNETDARTEAISSAVSGLATQAAVAAEITNRGTAIGNETDARIAAISNAVSGLATQAAVDAKESVANVNIIKDNLQGQINSLNNTPAWDTNVTYSTDDQVIYEDHIYRALRSTAGDQPDTSTSDWSLLGAYTSLASIIGANSAAITQLNLVDSSSTSSTAKLLSSLSSSVDSLAGAVDAIEGEAWNSSSYFPANSIVRAGLMESIEWAYGSSSAPNLLSYDINERAIRLQDTSDLSVGMVFYAFPVVAGNTYDLTLSYKADRTDSNGVYVRVYEQDATALPAGKAFVSHNASTSADEVEEDTRKASINPSKESIGVTTAFQTLTSTYTPTSTAKWASIVVLNWSSMDPSLWSPSTTYSAGTTIRRDVNSVIRLFESLQGSNSNQDPRTADTYWEDLGPYVPNALFVKDVSVVQKDSSAAVVKEWNYKSRLFKATQASTTKTLDDTTYWEDLGPGDLSGHVKTTKASIDNLTSTFGSTTAAASSASAASDSAIAAASDAADALIYKNDAARSESNASGSASTASTKEGLATNAASAASDSATAAFNHKEAAAQSESNAAGSASTASTKEGLATSAASAASDSATEALGYKDDAARSESNAASSASTASNKEGLATSAASAASDSATEAFNHKEAAAQSKSDAAGFASTASDKATLATSASTTIYTGGFIGKNTFEDGLTGLWGGGIAAVANAPAGHPLGRTKALHQTSRDSYYLPLTPDSYYSNSAHGKTFRVTGYVYNSSTVGNNSNGGYSSMAARAGLQSRDDQAGREWPTVIAAGIGLNQWVKYDGTFSVDDSNGQRMLPFLQIAGTTVNSDVFSAYWTDMTLTDVTSETNATTQADLASGYATTALGYKDDAARSESNAAGSASTASTKQGLATSAASAATTQAGLASDSATEAFNHKEAAAQSESNAAGSASTASTKEGLATSAASAATTQAGLASNYSSAAFSHKEAAAQSKSDAAGSASAAVNTLSNITASIAGESPVWDHDSTSTSYQVDDYVQAGMLQACVPSYSVDSSSNVSLTYDPVEASLKILSTTDSTTGVAFEAFRTVPSANYRISMSIKNDTSYRSSGLYVRIYRANSLSAGKLYVGHSLSGSNPNFSVIQQQNNMATINSERYEVPNATGVLVPHVDLENADIGKDWVRCTFDFNASSTYPFASINVLNWSGNSTYPLYVKEVTVTEVLSGGGLGRAWSYDGRRYVCTADTTTNQPLNDTNYWKYLGPTSSSLTSSIRSVNEVSADIDTVVASQTTQLTALNTTVQTTASTSGLMGQFSVKIDANGHVSGFGLATTNAGATPSSAFIVRADKFAIIDPSDTGNALGTTSPDNAILPFVIDDGTTYIKNAMIKDASITAAKIGTVDADTITTGYLSSAIIEAGTIDASKLTINSDTIESFSDTQTGSTGLKIKNLAVRTLHIADGSVFIPRLIEFAAGEYVQTLVGGYDYTFRTLGQSSALDFSDTQLSASIAVYTEWDINYRVQGRTSSSFFNNYTFSSLHRLWLVLRVQDNAMDGSGWITRSTYTLHVEPTPDNNRSTSTFNFNGDKWLILSLADTVNRGNVRFVMDVVGGITGSNFGNGSLTLRLEWENKDVLIMAGKK